MNRLLQDQQATTWKLLDDERPGTIIDSASTLDAAIRQLPDNASTPNRIVNLQSPEGDTLSIGIAGMRDSDNPKLQSAVACANFTQASGDPPYLAVLGDAELNLKDGGIVVFRFEGTWTEILRRNCVPVDVMLRIALHYYGTGKLPDWIAWEEV